MPKKECWFGQECTAGVRAIMAGIQLNILYLIKLVSRAVYHGVRARGAQQKPKNRGQKLLLGSLSYDSWHI